jgi:hypothetical protein
VKTLPLFFALLYRGGSLTTAGMGVPGRCTILYIDEYIDEPNQPRTTGGARSQLTSAAQILCA